MVTPRDDPETGRPFDVGYDVLFIDPYTGARLGEGRRGAPSLERKALMRFLYKLYYGLPNTRERVMFGIYVRSVQPDRMTDKTGCVSMQLLVGVAGLVVRGMDYVRGWTAATITNMTATAIENLIALVVASVRVSSPANAPRTQSE